VTEGRTDLGMPSPRPLTEEPHGAAPAVLRFVHDGGRRYALSVLDVGLACCAVEFVAATMSRPDLFATEGDGAASADGSPVEVAEVVEVMVVSGTVTDKMAPAVRAVYEGLAEPRHVVSFGSCANSGGPYWDSYCVTKGVDQIVPVDVYVPGCPPRPEALVQGLRLLEQRIDGRPE
jgi:NADH-quinone oxidoreductase subunit B